MSSIFLEISALHGNLDAVKLMLRRYLTSGHEMVNIIISQIIIYRYALLSTDDWVPNFDTVGPCSGSVLMYG